MTATKVCTQCKVDLPVGSFRRVNDILCGLRGKCRQCEIAGYRAYQLKVRGRNKARFYEVHREAELQRMREYRRTERGREKKRVSEARMKEKYPERHQARRIATAALKAGRITRGPCEKCGTLKVEAHHHDYSKPLEITWLCPDHHYAEHGRRPTLAPRETP